MPPLLHKPCLTRRHILPQLSLHTFLLFTDSRVPMHHDDSVKPPLITTCAVRFIAIYNNYYLNFHTTLPICDIGVSCHRAFPSFEVANTACILLPPLFMLLTTHTLCNAMRWHLLWCRLTYLPLSCCSTHNTVSQTISPLVVTTTITPVLYTVATV